MKEAIAQPVEASGGLGTFERYLSIWVALCMAAGIGLGKLLPSAVAGLRGYRIRTREPDQRTDCRFNSMALLAWAFFRIIFAAFIASAEADQYIAGCIILAAAPCRFKSAGVFRPQVLLRGETIGGGQQYFETSFLGDSREFFVWQGRPAFCLAVLKDAC